MSRRPDHLARRPPHRAPSLRAAGRWMVTFAGFPIGGLRRLPDHRPGRQPAPRAPRRPDHRCHPRCGPGLGARPEPPARRRVDRGHRARPDGRARSRVRSRRLRHQPLDLVAQGAVTGLAVGLAQARRPPAASRPTRPRLARLPRRRLGRRLGGHHGRRHRRRQAVHRLRLQRRPHRRRAHPRPPDRPQPQQETSHEQARRLRHRPDRPPRGRAARRPGRRRGRRQPQRPRAPSPAPRSSAATPPTPAFTTRVAAGADAVYFCLNAMNYARWSEEFPPLQRGVLAGAEAAGARLVVLDNLYAYGPTHGRDLVETMQARPTSAKSATRAAMTVELMASARGRPGRGRDRPGLRLLRSRRHRARPSARPSSAPHSTGRTAQVMGDPDQPHSYSYTPDVAAALITLATAPGATGQHLAPARGRDPHHPPGRRAGLRARRAASPRSSPPARPRCACSGSSSPRCASTCTRSTSSPTAGSSTTASSGRRSATRHPPRRRPGHHPRVVPAAARDHRRIADRHHPMNATMAPPAASAAAAAAMASAALLAIAGFTALGSVFDYPQILQEPTSDILALYREHRAPSAAGSSCWWSARPCSPRPGSCSAAWPAAGSGAGPRSSASPPRPSR